MRLMGKQRCGVGVGVRPGVCPAETVSTLKFALVVRLASRKLKVWGGPAVYLIRKQ